MNEAFHIACLMALAYMASKWSAEDWPNIVVKLTFTGLAAWAAVVVALDYVQ